MKTFIALLLTGAVVVTISGQEIFRTKWKGTALQAFSGIGSINHFSASGPDGWGYVYLKAFTGSNSADIIRDRWQGMRVQAFTPGSPITGFETNGPDFEGWVTLTAVAANGAKGDILMTRWAGTGVQGYSVPAGQAINGFTVSGPDADGYVTLSAVAGPIGVGEKQDDTQGAPALVFALNPVSPNPSAGPVQIAYSVAQPTPVSLAVYDCTGRLVKTIVAGSQQPGRYSVRWSGTDNQGGRVGTGVYFLRMNAGEFKATRKIIVVK